MFLTEGASTSNFKPVTDLSLCLPKTSNINYVGRDLPTPDMKEEKDTVSVDEHTYIIIEQINTEDDKLADNAVVIKVSESRLLLIITQSLARGDVGSLEISARMVVLFVTLSFITF